MTRNRHCVDGAGCGPLAFAYRDFGSEDGVTAAVLERYGQTVLVAVEALLSGPESYGAKLDALLGSGG